MTAIRRKNLQAIIDQLEELKSSLKIFRPRKKSTGDTSGEYARKRATMKKADEACDNLSGAGIIWKKSSAASKTAIE